MALKMLVFACVGVALGVAFTAASDFRKTRDPRLLGYTYLWMFPIYAAVPWILSALYPRIAGAPLASRLAVYVALVYAVEYGSGWVLRKALGQAPWEPNYRGRRWAVHGLIRLDYAPFWAAACWLFERLYLAL